MWTCFAAKTGIEWIDNVDVTNKNGTIKIIKCVKLFCHVLCIFVLCQVLEGSWISKMRPINMWYTSKKNFYNNCKYYILQYIYNIYIYNIRIQLASYSYLRHNHEDSTSKKFGFKQEGSSSRQMRIQSRRIMDAMSLACEGLIIDADW